MSESAERASHFRALHVPGNPFILANAWDIGSARMLAAMGAKALATTSAGHAFTLGRPDMGHVSRDEALAHASDLHGATSLPVSGDFEDGFGPEIKDVVETVLRAGQVGLAGCSIEDTALPSEQPYTFDFAVERIEAAVDARQALGRDFVLTARADGLMLGTYDLQEAIKRLQAFEKAGADVLYAPMPDNMDAVREICRAVSAPVNVICAGKYTANTVADFASAGAARISLGSALARATHQIILEAGKAMFEEGRMDLLGRAASGDVVDAMLEGRA